MTTVLQGHQLARLLGRWQGGRAVPDYAALAATVRGLLSDGRLPLGVRLPAERELAQALRISRTTVSAAYRVLRETGHLTSRRGAGSWTTLPGGVKIGTSGLWTPDDDCELLDLGSAALPAPAQLATAAAEALADLPRYLSSPGYHPTGLIELRSRIAERYTERGLPTEPEQIMVTSGVQQALDLGLRLLVPVGQAVLVESPTYPNALAAIVARRGRVITHGLVPESGWDPDLLLSTIRQNQPRLAYLVPEFQNPTGHLMPPALRERLPRMAHVAGTDLIIDESFVDLALDEPAMPLPVAEPSLPPPVAVYDRHARVLSIGGMSKPYWGGLRIGWIRAAAPLVQRLAVLRTGVDMAGPVLDQLVAARLLRYRAAVLAERRVQLHERRAALVSALRAELPEWRFRVPAGGLCLWLELDAPISGALARSAESYGVRLAAGPRFGMDGTMERFLRLPYTLPPDQLTDAVKRIAAARNDLDRPARRWDTPALVA